jgi:hypothetical protein
VPSAEFTIPHVPPSMNRADVRSHWKGFHNEKRAWQGRFVKALDELDLPRPLPAVGPVRIDVTLTFETCRDRDGENYRPVLSKALGDALTGPMRDPDRAAIIDGARYICGWLRNDTDRDWQLTLQLDDQPGVEATTVRLTWDW